MTVYRGPAGYDTGPAGALVTAAALGASSTNGSGTVTYRSEGRRFAAAPDTYPTDLCIEYENQRTVWTDAAYGATIYWAGWVYQPEHPSSELIISEFRNTGGTVQSGVSFGTAGGLKLLGASGATVASAAGDQAEGDWYWLRHKHLVSGTTTLEIFDAALVQIGSTLSGACGTAAVTRHREGRAAAIAGKTRVDEGTVTDTLPTTTIIASLVSAWVGDITSTSFRVATHTRGATQVRIDVRLGGLSVLTTAAQVPDAQGYSHHQPTGLLPKSAYDYRVEGFDGSNWILLGKNDV